MSTATVTWEQLTSFSDTYTCYSAAVATWVAADDDQWPTVVNPGLWLSLADADDGLFGFGHFPPGLRAKLGLLRRGSLDPDARQAVEAVRTEIRRSGRVIVAGDGFNLPWHVAFDRSHVPHWFVLVEGPQGLAVTDPFACRNELGVQTAHTGPVEQALLSRVLLALPGDDPVHRLRESVALGDVSDISNHRYQWFVHGEAGNLQAPIGLVGPDAVLRLSRHFRERGQDLAAYAQTDDIWSIARHRAFLCRYAEMLADGDADAWLAEHGLPLAKHWSHMAPLLMQATLALGAGRTASSSVPDKLEELAERERAAAAAFPTALSAGSI